MWAQIRARWLYLLHEQLLPLTAADFETIESDCAVILVPGWGASAGCMRLLKKYLEGEGFAVYQLAHKKQFAAPEEYVPALAGLIRSVPQAEVNIVAHSMGGMITEIALQDSELLARVRRVVATAVPWHGCYTSNLFVWTNARDALRHRTPGSYVPSPVFAQKLHLLIPRWDDVVWSRRQQELPGIATTVLPFGGHTLTTDPRLFPHVRDALC